MSFFSQDGDLSWVDEQVQAELKHAMIIGAFDNVDPAVAYIQYIPPNMDLTTGTETDSKGDTTINNTTTSTNSVVTGGEDKDEAALSSAPAWSWILGSFGFIGIVVALFLLYRQRKNHRVNTDNTDFQSVTSSPKKSKGSFPVPIEILDDNSEFDEIYKDDEENEEDAIYVKPPSWRQVPEPNQGHNDEYSRLQINATDPNQPVVKPVLDEEAETYISNV